MYTAYYNLTTKPFQISSDTQFMWLGENHKEALATLRYGILDNKGFLLLTGDVGTGKTTLINTLIGSLSNDVIFASVPDPSLDKMDFFNYIAAAFGLGGDFTTKGKFLSSFTGFLHKAYENNKKVLLIIDESQLLTQELLEEVRLLSNIVTRDSNPLLNIFFVGQYEFNELIRRPENRAIAQRLTLNFYIEPLTAEETGEYIRHRLKIAGTTEKIFNTSAIKQIYASSQGYPRKINILCDHCLMSGYAEDKKIITSSIVRDSARELEIPDHRQNQVEPDQDHARMVGGAAAGTSESPKTTKSSLWWPFMVLLLLLGVLLAGSYYFLYYTNERFKEATAHFTAIQEQTVNPAAVAAPEVNKSVGAQGKPEVAEKNTETTSSAVPATTAPLEGADGAVNPDRTSSASSPADTGAAEDGPVAATEVAPLVVASRISPATDTLAPSGALPVEDLVIRFKYDSNLFSIEDIERMKEFAEIVKQYPEATVNIFGYTDSSGDADYNQRLSEFRANMVKSFLMGQNLAPEKLVAKGLGNTNPIDSNATEAGRTNNRRVEISVMAKE